MTGFRKSRGSQHCLLKMLENWKSALDKSESVCALFMDLSKAFDTINHDLLLAKLKAYGFSREALTLMCSYLKNRKQKVVINNSASTTQTVIAGVPQGSIDGPLLFNLFINDLVLFIEYTALGNYADDNNLSITGTNIENIKKLLLADFKTVIEWFSDNYMIINPDKCKYMCMGKNSYDNDTLSLNEFNLKNSDHEIILGITIDRKLTFNKHIKNLCKKAGQKLSALLRISPYLDENKKKLLYCSMIKSQFNYCPLVWMFCSRKSNNLINKVQERALRLITNDYQSSFNILLDKCNEFSIQQRNLEALMIELYKIIHQIAPPIMNSLFVFRENTHNIRNYQILSNNVRKTVRYGLETIFCRSHFLWANLPQAYKLQKSLSAFKRKMRQWNGEICVSRLCKVYEPNIGFI